MADKYVMYRCRLCDEHIIMEDCEINSEEDVEMLQELDDFGQIFHECNAQVIGVADPVGIFLHGAEAAVPTEDGCCGCEGAKICGKVKE